jgi:hypothetical protein
VLRKRREIRIMLRFIGLNSLIFRLGKRELSWRVDTESEVTSAHSPFHVQSSQPLIRVYDADTKK